MLLRPSEIKAALQWLDMMSDEWRGEIPTRLHVAGSFGLGSAPPFSPEFIGYIGNLECKVPGCKECGGGDRTEKMATSRHINHESRRRTKRAMNRLRKVSPIEWDAVYSYCVRGLIPEDIARELTARAVRLEKPERYSLAAVHMLLVAGADKTRKVW